MKCLNLVIGCDSSPMHLAGALGVPFWVVAAFSCDYRWMVERDDSPWYPTARLFRQTKPGDWDGVFGRMAEAVSAVVDSRPKISRVEIDVAPAELLDKITILEIKSQRISDETKLRHVRHELTILIEAAQPDDPVVRRPGPTGSGAESGEPGDLAGRG